MIAYLDNTRYIVAWCESREGYRHFRTDRERELEVLEESYPGRRTSLIRAWEADRAAKTNGTETQDAPTG